MRILVEIHKRVTSAYIFGSLLVTNCAAPSNSLSLVDSPEVSVYDEYVADKETVEIFDLLVKRANEPYVLAGEDVSGLTLTTLSLFKKIGDQESAREILSATEEQRSAVQLFIRGSYLSSDFPRTRKLVDSIAHDPKWPSVRAERAN